ncbi:MAG: hypothetical protein ABT20_02255 [Rubrivivax sp. SCN 70-15]|nr:MAG: hypothetical protein ABT20_02255 [Rubrivivax sp. SCN 70-15]
MSARAAPPAARAGRRGLLGAAAVLPWLAAALAPAAHATEAAAGTAAAASGAAPARPPFPPVLHALDRAAMNLFDAPVARHWPAARDALARARKAAAEVGPLEPAFVDAGGDLSRFYRARNDLGADLLEARTALDAKDERWLASCADRIADRAGTLSLPFDARSDKLTPGVESLLALARRMRNALVWQDDAGFRNAHEDFKTLWASLRQSLAARSETQVHALDVALNRIAISRAPQDLQALEQAVRNLRHGLR